MPSNMSDEITYPFPNFNSCTIEIWEWTSYFIWHIIMDVIITYPCWGLSKMMSVKGATDETQLGIFPMVNTIA